MTWASGEGNAHTEETVITLMIPIYFLVILTFHLVDKCQQQWFETGN